MSEPLISVIVPVYNVEGYLDACLESVTSQTYRNLEILVVDDGSTDGSGAACDCWAERDERIRVIHQKNGGLSAARNSALDVMSGELVTMVDSDDLLHPDAISLLYEMMEQTGADITVGNYVTIGDKDIPNWIALHTHGIRHYDQQEAILAVFYQEELYHSAWGRLYRSTLFDGLRYPVGKLYEDLAVIYPQLKRCSNIAMTDQAIYGYRRRESSILETFSPRRADVLDTLEQLEKDTEDHDTQYLQAVRSRLLSAYFNILLLSSQDKITDHSQLQDRCWLGIKRLRSGCLTDSRVRMKNKLGILASYGGRWLLCSVLGRRYQPRT